VAPYRVCNHAHANVLPLYTCEYMHSRPSAHRIPEIRSLRLSVSDGAPRLRTCRKVNNLTACYGSIQTGRLGSFLQVTWYL
jgi:hypothetical protein